MVHKGISWQTSNLIGGTQEDSDAHYKKKQIKKNELVVQKTTYEGIFGHQKNDGNAKPPNSTISISNKNYDQFHQVRKNRERDQGTRGGGNSSPVPQIGFKTPDLDCKKVGKTRKVQLQGGKQGAGSPRGGVSFYQARKQSKGQH